VFVMLWMEKSVAALTAPRGTLIVTRPSRLVSVPP
jgi:hypothetical protein